MSNLLPEDQISSLEVLQNLFSQNLEVQSTEIISWSQAALAEEARTQNLISYLQLLQTTETDHDHQRILRIAIRERLELPQP